MKKLTDKQRDKIRKLQDELLKKYPEAQDDDVVFSFGVTVRELKQFIFPELVAEIKTVLNSK